MRFKWHITESIRLTADRLLTGYWHCCDISVGENPTEHVISIYLPLVVTKPHCYGTNMKLNVLSRIRLLKKEST